MVGLVVIAVVEEGKTFPLPHPSAVPPPLAVAASSEFWDGVLVSMYRPTKVGTPRDRFIEGREQEKDRENIGTSLAIVTTAAAVCVSS